MGIMSSQLDCQQDESKNSDQTESYANRQRALYLYGGLGAVVVLVVVVYFLSKYFGKRQMSANKLNPKKNLSATEITKFESEALTKAENERVAKSKLENQQIVKFKSENKKKINSLIEKLNNFIDAANPIVKDANINENTDEIPVVYVILDEDKFAEKVASIEKTREEIVAEYNNLFASLKKDLRFYFAFEANNIKLCLAELIKLKGSIKNNNEFVSYERKLVEIRKDLKEIRDRLDNFYSQFNE